MKPKQLQDGFKHRIRDAGHINLLINKTGQPRDNRNAEEKS